MKHRLIPCVMIQPDSLHPLLPSYTVHGVQKPKGLFFIINIACKCSLCLNWLQKLNGVRKSPSNIPTWACEFIPRTANTEAIEKSSWRRAKLLLSSLREIYLRFTAWLKQTENVVSEMSSCDCDIATCPLVMTVDKTVCFGVEKNPKNTEMKD